MDINDILAYVKKTPENTNINVLSSMIESLPSGEGGIIPQEGYTVTFNAWPSGSMKLFGYVKTDGNMQCSYAEDVTDIITNVCLGKFLINDDIRGSSGTIQMLDGTTIDLSEASKAPQGLWHPLTDITVEYDIPR